jgi:hypothetical protein
MCLNILRYNRRQDKWKDTNEELDTVESSLTIALCQLFSMENSSTFSATFLGTVKSVNSGKPQKAPSFQM